MREALLAVDIGTTNVKGSLFLSGVPVTSSSRRISLAIDPDLGSAEQDPEEIAQAVFSVIRELAPRAGDRALSIALSSQMHALGVIGEDGKPKSRLLTYFDTRAAPLLGEVEKAGYDLYLETGCPPLHVYPLAKILFLKSKGVIGRGDRFLISAKDYVALKLTGEHALDFSTASGSQLLNVTKLRWSSLALSLAGVEEEMLPRLLEGSEALSLSPEAAETLGLPEGTAVHLGLSDAAANQLGVGVEEDTELAANLGTSAAVRVLTRKPFFDDERMRFFVYYAGGGRWLVGGAVNNGGIVLDWCLRTLAEAELEYSKLAGDNPFNILDRLLQRSPPGARGLLALPFIAGGERFPIRSPAARGVIYGLTYAHTRADIVRALVEGVAFNLKWIYTAMLERGAKQASMVRVGGGAASLASWRQVLADVLGTPVCYTPGEDAALRGLQAYISGSLCRRECSELHQPSEHSSRIYERVFEDYLRLCSTLRSGSWL